MVDGYCIQGNPDNGVVFFPELNFKPFDDLFLFKSADIDMPLLRVDIVLFSEILNL